VGVKPTVPGVFFVQSGRFLMVQNFVYLNLGSDIWRHIFGAIYLNFGTMYLDFGAICLNFGAKIENRVFENRVFLAPYV